MKKNIIILVLLLTLVVSIWMNISKMNNEEVLLDTNNTINKNCYYMYVGYYMNTDDTLEFHLPHEQKCLLDDLFKIGYEHDGINQKMLDQLLIFKERNPESSVMPLYIEALKKRFYIEVWSLNYGAAKIALEIIWDKEFEEKIISEGVYIPFEDIEKN